MNGWWEYDERASTELESRLQQLQDCDADDAERQPVFEMLIAGFMYVIDLDNNIQYRRGIPQRRRRIKRDAANIADCKVSCYCSEKCVLWKINALLFGFQVMLIIFAGCI